MPGARTPSWLREGQECSAPATGALYKYSKHAHLGAHRLLGRAGGCLRVCFVRRRLRAGRRRRRWQFSLRSATFNGGNTVEHFLHSVYMGKQNKCRRRRPDLLLQGGVAAAWHRRVLNGVGKYKKEQATTARPTVRWHGGGQALVRAEQRGFGHVRTCDVSAASFLFPCFRADVKRSEPGRGSHLDRSSSTREGEIDGRLVG